MALQDDISLAWDEAGSVVYQTSRSASRLASSVWSQTPKRIRGLVALA
jgi:hypothetical protein